MVITSAFPFAGPESGPYHHLSEKERKAGSGGSSAVSYQLEILESLKEVGGDDTVVGWYTSTTSPGSFLTWEFLQTHSTYQEALGDRCVALVYGKWIMGKEEEYGRVCICVHIRESKWMDERVI